MQTKECRRALDQLAGYLATPALDLFEKDAAVDHIHSCADCRARVAQLIRAYNANVEDDLTCEDCEDSLPDYLTAIADEQAGLARWRPVTLHLILCPHCAATLAELSDLLELAEGRQGMEPPEMPAPQLSFLRAQSNALSPSAIPWRLDQFGRLIIEFSADLISTFQSATRQSLSAAAGLKSRQAPGLLFQGDLNDINRDLEISITAEQVRRDPTRCTLLVDVHVLSRGGWPNLAGTKVTLKCNDQEDRSQRTDAYGTAVFEGIAVSDLAQLVVQIQPVT